METMNAPELPRTIDIDAMLAPIPGDSPAGIELREDPKQSRVFYAVRNARKAEIENERTRNRFASMTSEELERELNSLQSDPRRQPNWGGFIESATKLLVESSKDLWVVAWLIEALVREEGIAGFRDGFQLCQKLCESYWEHIQPRPSEDEGWEWTLSQLNGLNGTIKASLPHIPVLPSNWLAPRERSMTVFTYREAEKIHKLDPAERTLRIQDGATTLEDFHTAVTKAPLEEIEAILATIEASRRSLTDYFTTLQQLCPEQVPAVSDIEEELESYSNLYRQLVAKRLAAKASDASLDSTALANASNSMDGHANKNEVGYSKVMTREDALAGLLRVADFFRRTEPHSPVSYSLEQAVRWGRMSLPELMSNLIDDETVRREMFRRLGIQVDNDHESETSHEAENDNY